MCHSGIHIPLIPKPIPIVCILICFHQLKGSLFLAPVSPLVRFEGGENCVFFWTGDFWKLLVVYRSALRFLAASRFLFFFGWRGAPARPFRRPWVDGNQKKASLTMLCAVLCLHCDTSVLWLDRMTMWLSAETHQVRWFSKMMCLCSRSEHVPER